MYIVKENQFMTIIGRFDNFSDAVDFVEGCEMEDKATGVYEKGFYTVLKVEGGENE